MWVARFEERRTKRTSPSSQQGGKQKTKTLKDLLVRESEVDVAPPVSHQGAKRSRTEPPRPSHTKRSRNRPRKTRPPDRVPERAVGVQVR
jgi:hypothetical protein